MSAPPIALPSPESRLGVTRSGATADLAVILVHYHAPAPLAAAVAALGRDLDTASLVAEWRIVDNGSTAEERAALATLGLPLIDGGGNHGFAAGVNRGIASAAAANLLVLNPDVEVLPGCARALLDELGRGAGAVAPRLYWDPARRFLLPLGEERSRGWELLVLASKRWPRCAARARRRSRRDARRHWEARDPLPSARLSGAALMISRAAWTRVGPFDEGYRLYFEETDWLLRLEAAGLEARQVSAAEAAHAFAHSTRDEPQARIWFDQSARRFGTRHYGAWFVRLRDLLVRWWTPGGPSPTAGMPSPWREDTLENALPGVAGERTVWLELSPSRDGFPAAGERVRGSELARWRPPLALMRASGLDGMSLCAVSEDGGELGRWWIDVAASGQPAVDSG